MRAEAAGSGPGTELTGAASGGGLSGIHMFVGTEFMGGPALLFASANGASATEVKSGYLWALRVGAYFNKLELAVELSPKSYWPTGDGSAFQMNGTIGYLSPIHESADIGVYWPFRAGVGFVAPDQGSVSFQTRLDLVGVAIRVGHAVIDLHVPSYRYLLMSGALYGTDLHVFSWDFGGGVSYYF